MPGPTQRVWARLTLVVLAFLLAFAALVPISAEDPSSSIAPAAPAVTGARGADVDFYRRVVARLQAGEGYYAFIVAEQRQAGYPVRPGLTVRLPTLAVAEAALGPLGMRLTAIGLLIAVLAAWWRRLGAEPGPRRLAACAAVLAGSALALNSEYLTVHELWAGLLMALALALYRPPSGAARALSDWLPALLAGGLALAIREHSLPFAVLLAALAWRRGSRAEALAWSALVLLFLLALAAHLQAVAPHVLPGDPTSPSWLTLRGLAGVVSPVVLSTGLHLFPHWLSGPLVILAFAGWIGWSTPTGRLGAALFLGYAVLFAATGRPDNFYWGMLLAPGLLLGLAFAPGAVKSLFRTAFAR
ncbi:MAG: hypothetical protein ACTHLU_09230 [Novosphingobium sp.]